MALSRVLMVSCCLVLGAVLYRLYSPVSLEARSVIELAGQWDERILLPARNFSRISIGVNANLDLIVSALELLSALNATASPPADTSTISSVASLQELVGYSMENCAGVERVFTPQEQFLKTVDAAKQLHHTYHVGGNAALMAEKVMQFYPSAQVMLAGPVGPTLRDLLHKDILLPPAIETMEDEVHMILEYSKGSVWGRVTAACANRVIYSHDISNSRLVALEQFRDSLGMFKPDLIILSGAHLLEGEASVFQESRLGDIASVLETVPREVPVHWELATVGDLNYFKQMANTLFTRIDSLGLNEQELRSAAVSAGAPFDFSTIPLKPLPGHVSDFLFWLMNTYSNKPASRLTRVHFHSLTFHVMATLSGGPWKNVGAAVMAGARVAGLQACDNKQFHSDFFDLKLDKFKLSQNDNSPTLRYQPLENSTIRWTRGSVNFELSPVLVCKDPTKTVGLGDAISSVGLLYSQFEQ